MVLKVDAGVLNVDEQVLIVDAGVLREGSMWLHLFEIFRYDF